MTGAEQAQALADDLAYIARFRESTEVNPQSVMAACLRTIDALSASEAALREAREEANGYRIEADCAMRDYDGLELTAGLYREALEQIANPRPNRTFDPWARDIARAVLARAGEGEPKPGQWDQCYCDRTYHHECPEHAHLA